jgi:hypothetical protein
MEKIPYCFIWSDNYKIFADILKNCINCYPNLLEDKSTYIPQSFFDQHLNKAPGHFLTGMFLKLEKTFELLNTLAENSYFIFSDADIIVFPNKAFEDLINLYVKVNADIVFMKETPNMLFSNVGFSLIKVCDVNRKLFRQALEMSTNEPTGLDGCFINEALKNYKGSHFYFPTEFVMTSSSLIYYGEKKYDTKMKEQLMVFQALCDPTQSKESVLYQKLSQYKMLGIPIQFT